MKTILISLLLFFQICKAQTYDICVYGGTSSGVIAAYSAAKMGHSVLLIEPSNFLGGLSAGGLGNTDLGTGQVVLGIANDFYKSIGNYYGTSIKYKFEPHVAEAVFNDYIHEGNVNVLFRNRITKANLINNNIKSIDLESVDNNFIIKNIKAKYFIDCTYEGDLMAKAGVSYVIGRESNSVYNETLNGVERKLSWSHQFPDGVDPYKIKGNPSSGLLWGISTDALSSDGTGDKKIQAYNFRICLTNDSKNKIELTKPKNYDPLKYELLIRLIEAQPDKNNIYGYFNWSFMPKNKTDINNNGGFSTDMIGMNYNYPEATYTDRALIYKDHSEYTVGLLYFLSHDNRVPESIRSELIKWGYPKDEYVNNNYWSPQLYVRESRRMVGSYIMTEANCLSKIIVEDGIVSAGYNIDSHNCQRIVVLKNGVAMVKNEGDIQYPIPHPFPIAYRAILPKETECNNLIVPVCLSASHIAYGSIRMEPVFMQLGQVAAMAAVFAIDKGLSLKEVSADEISTMLIENPLLKSLNDVSQEKSNISINIVSNVLTVKTNIVPIQIYIYSLDGKVVIKKNLNTESTNLDIDRFTNGVYVVKAEHENMNYSIKFIKQ
jgi:hypothetical protein